MIRNGNSRAGKTKALLFNQKYVILNKQVCSSQKEQATRILKDDPEGEAKVKARGHLPARTNSLTQTFKATDPVMKLHSSAIPAGNLVINDMVSAASGDT